MLIRIGTHLVIAKKRYEVKEIYLNLDGVIEKFEGVVRAELTESSEREAKYSRHSFSTSTLETLVKLRGVEVINEND